MKILPIKLLATLCLLPFATQTFSSVNVAHRFQLKNAVQLHRLVQQKRVYSTRLSTDCNIAVYSRACLIFCTLRLRRTQRGMSEENASYVGNQAASRASDRDGTGSPADVKEKHPLSQLSDGAEFNITDQSDEESTSSGDEVDDETAESDLKPYIFSSDGTRRSFLVQQITRANSSHRPSFTFVGSAVEYTDGSLTERSRQNRDGSHMARGGQSQRIRVIVVEGNLSLNITYEPPSPKFHQQCPGSSSYRLKLFKESNFLYSVRGLPQQIRVHPNAYIVRWGPLELQFKSKQQLDIFASSIKHVNLEWTPSGQHTARQTAATLQSSRPDTPLRPATPLETTDEARPAKRSSFGSPLPLSDASEKKTAQSGATQSSHAGDDGRAIGRSFWKDNWVWVGISVAVVAAVTYSAFKADMSKEAVKGQEFKLHIVD